LYCKLSIHCRTKVEQATHNPMVAGSNPGLDLLVKIYQGRQSSGKDSSFRSNNVSKDLSKVVFKNAGDERLANLTFH